MTKPVRYFTADEIHDFILLSLRTKWTTLAYMRQFEADLNAAIDQQRFEARNFLKDRKLTQGLALLFGDLVSAHRGRHTTLRDCLEKINTGFSVGSGYDMDDIAAELILYINNLGDTYLVKDVLDATS